MSLLPLSVFIVFFILMLWLAYDTKLENCISLIYTGKGLSALSLLNGIRVHTSNDFFFAFGFYIALTLIGLFQTIRSGIGIKIFAKKSIIPFVVMTFIVIVSRWIVMPLFNLK